MTDIVCDVLVVGAGPAGSSAARAAARKGAKVLVLDRREVVGVPVQCAEYVPAQLVGQLDLGRDFVAQKVTGMNTFLPDGSEHWLPAPGFIIHRDRFDQTLARAAREQGASFLMGTRALGREDGVVHARGRAGQLDIRAAVVVGADGPRSTVASWVGSPNPSLMPAAQVTMALTGPCERTEVYFHPDIFGGYAWLFPKGDRANVGLGLRSAPGSTRKINDLLEAFVDRLRREGRVTGPRLGGTGGWLPAGPVRRAVHGDVALCGDAAGHTHPITGAGIFAAVSCGEMAGKWAARAALQAAPDLLEGYEEEWRDLFGDMLSKAHERREMMERGWDRFEDIIRPCWVAFREYHA